MALVNTGTLTNHVMLTFLDSMGPVMFRDVLTLAAGNHTAFSTPGNYPSVAGKFGTIYVQADTSFLAGLGLRFNLQSGRAVHLGADFELEGDVPVRNESQAN